MDRYLIANNPINSKQGKVTIKTFNPVMIITVNDQRKHVNNIKYSGTYKDQTIDLRIFMFAHDIKQLTNE